MKLVMLLYVILNINGLMERHFTSVRKKARGREKGQSIV